MICAAILVLVGERNFDLLRILDDVVIGENLAIFAQDESRALPLLRHHAIEEIESESGGGHVDHGGKDAFVDGNIVLLLRGEGRLRIGLGERKRRHVLYHVEEKRAIPPKKAFVGGEIDKGSYEQSD